MASLAARRGRCDLPAYAAHCDWVHVVGDLAGLEQLAHRMAGHAGGG
jgi:hypothetical protein